MPDRDSPWRTLLRAELPEMPQTNMDIRDVGKVWVMCAMASGSIDWCILSIYPHRKSVSFDALAQGVYRRSPANL
jgi:hypothetical protein